MILRYPTAVSLQHGYNNLQGCRTCPFLGTESVIHVENLVQLLSADIIDRGIVPAGGGALLKNLDKRIREETGLPVCIADDPLCCVVVSTNEILSNFKLLRRISIE
jgi:actin-like ATPase involved in cell morphogenesis